MATYSLSSRSWRVILSGYANCDRRSERELYRTLSLAACASAKCHLHPFAQQSFRARNSFGVGKLWPRDWNLWIILETIKWIALYVKRGQCLCWRLIILQSQCHCQFGKVHEALCWLSTKRTFFVAHTRDVVWCCCLNRRWKQCRNQNRLALLLWLRTLLGTGTVRAVDVVLILYVSLTTKISNVIYHYFNIFPPGGREIGRHDRPRYNRFAL